MVDEVDMTMISRVECVESAGLKPADSNAADKNYNQGYLLGIWSSRLARVTENPGFSVPGLL